MTPLEEIEQAIYNTEVMHRSHPDRSNLEVAMRLQATLAALYQARAVERLEATVRMIGVQLQEADEEGGMASVEEACRRIEETIQKASPIKALESLEATIRNVAVFMAKDYGEVIASSPHEFRPQTGYPSPPSRVCRICGKAPGEGIHRIDTGSDIVLS